MKTLKTLTICVCLLLAALITKADDHALKAKAASPYFALNTYIGAVSTGKLADLDFAIDDNAKFSMLRGKSIMSFDKAEMMDFIKQTKGYEQNCAVKTTVVSSTGDVIIARVDLRYPTFTRSNYVTITNMGNIWKITDVYSVFK